MAEWGKILRVSEMRRMTPAGDISVYFRYQVQTKGGIVFTEDIPGEEVTEAKVEAVLKEKAQLLDKTKAL